MTSPLQYPVAKVGSEVDRAAGIEFADPYRWLEGTDARVAKWQALQDEITDRYINCWKHLPLLEAQVSHYSVDRISTLPRYAAGRWFRSGQMSGSTTPCIIISSELFSNDVEIPIHFDEVESRSGVISWLSPSPDGQTVALGICSDGSENNRIRLLAVDLNTVLKPAPAQILMDAWMGGVCWLPDSSGFYFLALEGDPSGFSQILLFHDMLTGLQERVDLPSPGSMSNDYTLISLSPDGSHLVASHGMYAPKPIAINDLRKPEQGWRSFVTDIDGTLAGFVSGDHFIAITDIGASRGRVVSIPLDAENPNDSRSWSELIAESDFVLRSISPIGGHLYLTGFVDTYSRVRVYDYQGNSVGKVPLPKSGAVGEPLFPLMTLIAPPHPTEYYFVFSSFTESWGVYRHVPFGKTIETVRKPQIQLENAAVTDEWAISADGTRIPYHIVRLTHSERAMPAPALIYAYGAFNLPLLPEYPGSMAAFIAAGGVYIHGHLRGGAEFGRDWWHSGRMKKKQNCFDDLYAIAEDVISKGITSPSQLAMTGRSNGGLMAAVAAVQRPKLWQAIVSQVPVSDLIGILRDPYGRYALSSEYGDPTDPEDIVRIASFSPYHSIRDGVSYPAVFIDAGATDPRCPPWHARKLAARLQAAAQNAKGPIMVRVRDKAGHGFATPKSVQLVSSTEWLSFVMRQLDMIPFSKSPGRGQ